MNSNDSLPGCKRMKQNEETHCLKLVALHGRCAKCGLYFEAQTYMAPLELEFPEKTVDYPHLHLTICCYRCRGIVNLIDVSKPSLKGRKALER